MCQHITYVIDKFQPYIINQYLKCALVTADKKIYTH